MRGVIVGLLGFIIGTGAGGAAAHYLLTRPLSWINIDATRHAEGNLPAAEVNYGISTAALAEDLPWPAVTSLSGKVRFVDAPGPDSHKRVGYVAELRMAEPPKAEWPARFKPEDERQGSVTLTGPDHITYTARITFSLRDEDGFELANATTAPVLVDTGVPNKLQELLPTPIPAEVARRTSAVRASIDLETCQTCAAYEK